MKHLHSHRRWHLFYKNKNILVTGGAGFIGSHLAERLCSYGANVTILDDLSTGSVANIQSFCDRVQLVASNITSFKACVKAMKKQEIIFHTAAFVSVPESVKSPAHCEKINVEGTANLLEAAAMNGASTFVFSSSAAVYGERNDVCCENDEPNPQSPYATSKLEGERLCKEYAQNAGLSTASLRYFNVYGDRQNPHGAYAGVVAKFTHNLLHKKPIVIYGDGNQKRDFIHVSKVVDANLLVGAHPSLRGDVFNVATGTSITLHTLLDNLEGEIEKKRTEVRFEPARQGDIVSSQANCEKYQKLTQSAQTVN